MSQHSKNNIVSKEIELIKTLLDLKIDTKVELNDTGWTSRVYMINSGEIVFKFPRTEKIKDEYLVEVPAYKAASTIKESILVPQVKWEHPNRNYIGYLGIKGQSMQAAVKTLTKKEKQHIGMDLGAFLKQFHQLHVNKAPTITHENECEGFKQKFISNLPELQKRLKRDDVDALKHFVYNTYPQSMNELGVKQGLCHGDLGFWNMIYNQHGKTGVIDFGDVGYYDTSIDFAGMYDQVILEAALKAYGGSISKEKIHLRMRMIPVTELTYFLNQNDQKNINQTIMSIKEFTLHAHAPISLLSN